MLETVSQTETIHFLPQYSQQWVVVNDGVMGGISQSVFFVNDNNQGVFSGEVSLENNGGFASARYRLQNLIPVGQQRQIIIKLKGDGKSYQFRVKSEFSQHHSYSHVKNLLVQGASVKTVL